MYVRDARENNAKHSAENLRSWKRCTQQLKEPKIFNKKKISKFINKNVVVQIMFFFSFCLLLITIHYLVNSDIEFTVNRAVKLILVTTCRP